MSEDVLYIRADMNPTISTGHVMRCLSVADAAVRMGKKAVFITADDNPSGLIRGRGHECIVLGTRWDDMEGELGALKEVIGARKIKRLLLDSYSVTYDYLKRLGYLTDVYYLDDLNSFKYPVHAVIDYAVYSEDEFYPDKDPSTEYYLGCKYVPLRQAFENAGPKKINERIGNLLIMTGGSDPYGIAEGLLNELPLDSFDRVNVICGMFSGREERLKELFGSHPSVRIFPFVEKVWELYEEADAAVSAGGSTLYELASMGVPAITYSFADNQIPNVTSFDKKGLMPCAGDARRDDIYKRIVGIIDDLGPSEKRKNISERLMKLVDGHGAERMAGLFLN